MNKEIEEKYIKLGCKAKFLKQIMDLQRSIVNETALKFYKDKIIIWNVDPANVCMIQQIIPIESLEEYKFINSGEDDHIKLGVDLDKLSHILRSATKDDMFKLTYDNSNDDNKAILNIGIFEQKMGLIDTSGMMESKVPNLNLSGEFIIGTKTFYDFLVQAGRVSDHIQMSINRDGITLYAEGDIDDVKVNIPKGLLSLHRCGDKEIKSLYSIDYLQTSMKHIKPLFEKVHIYIDNDNPLKMIGSGRIEMVYLQAPRIEDD